MIIRQPLFCLIFWGDMRNCGLFLPPCISLKISSLVGVGGYGGRSGEMSPKLMVTHWQNKIFSFWTGPTNWPAFWSVVSSSSVSIACRIVFFRHLFTDFMSRSKTPLHPDPHLFRSVKCAWTVGDDTFETFLFSPSFTCRGPAKSTPVLYNGGASSTLSNGRGGGRGAWNAWLSFLLLTEHTVTEHLSTHLIQWSDTVESAKHRHGRTCSSSLRASVTLVISLAK